MVSGRSIGRKLKDRLQTKLKKSAQSAQQTAKHQLDQVLLGLQHKGITIKDSQGLIENVGRSVLKRAEAIRAQIANTPLSPSWLREISLSGSPASSAVRTAGVADAATEGSRGVAREVPADATSVAEATVSGAAEDMQPEPLHFEARELATDEPLAPAGELEEDAVAFAIERADNMLPAQQELQLSDERVAAPMPRKSATSKRSKPAASPEKRAVGKKTSGVGRKVSSAAQAKSSSKAKSAKAGRASSKKKSRSVSPEA